MIGSKIMRLTLEHYKDDILSRKHSTGLAMLKEWKVSEAEITRNGFVPIPFPKTLTEKERQLFLYRYGYLESSQEISVRFGLSLKKTKSMLRRIRRKLGEQMESGKIP